MSVMCVKRRTVRYILKINMGQYYFKLRKYECRVQIQVAKFIESKFRKISATNFVGRMLVEM